MLRLTAILALMLSFVLPAGMAVAQTPPPPPAGKDGPLATAIFASGCFWCTESDFDKVPGVVKTLSGYIGGKTKNPTYEQIGRGDTGHAEAVEVTYDTSKVSYSTLVEYFWRTTDILDAGGQFCDRGSQYRPEIFAVDAEQVRIAEASKQKLVDAKRFAQPIVVKVTLAANLPFTVAEEYHQDYYKTNPIRYYTYRTGCGRDARLQSIWGKEAGGKLVLAQPLTQ
jgi:methionine-S-sulfoxide reductase